METFIAWNAEQARVKQLAAIAANGLTQSDEHWIRAIVRNPGRSWWRGGAYALRYLGNGRYQIRLGVSGNHFHFDGEIQASDKASQYADIARCIETHAKPVTEWPI